MRDRVRNQKAVVLPSNKKRDQRWAKEIEQSDAKERLKEIQMRPMISNIFAISISDAIHSF